LYGLAVHYYRAKQISLAEKYLDDFLRVSPHRSIALDLMATIQTGQGRLEEAEQLLQKALRLEPDATILKENLLNLEKLKKSVQTP
jgi:predicted Zn-dependent protease